jgi:hypothetical protein
LGADYRADQQPCQSELLIGPVNVSGLFTHFVAVQPAIEAGSAGLRGN